MADVKGLLADPEFQALDPASQKQALGRIDKDFSNLTDQQFTEFKAKLTPAPGLMQRAKDYFAGLPSPMDITRGQKTQGGFTPEVEAAMGGVVPGEAAPNVTRAVGQQLRGGRVGKFFTGIGEKAEKIAEDAKAAKDPDFARLKKSAEGWKPGKRPNPKSSGPNLSEEHGPAPTPKGPPSKAQAVSSKQPDVPRGTPEAPPKGRAPRGSDEFYETQGRADKVFRVADDMFRKKITAQALEAKGKPADMSESTWKHILFRLRGLETGRVKTITPE